MSTVSRLLSRIVLPFAFAASAVPAFAGGFTFAPYPQAHSLSLSQVTFENAQGKRLTLADFKGKVVLLNVWATWCPPCVREMPTLDKLQKLLGGKNFAVVPLSIDKGGIFAVKSFYDDNFIGDLPVYVDPTTDVLDTLDVLGTPTTILLDKQGKEIARTMGPQDWTQPAVVAQIRRYMAAPAGAGVRQTGMTASPAGGRIASAGAAARRD